MGYQLIQLSEKDYVRLSKLLSDKYGLKLPSEKHVMVQSRLQKRLHELKFDSFEAYCRFVFNPVNTSDELTKMIDYLSTNKTAFFRESRHFEILMSTVLPELCHRRSLDNDPLIRCWSAGCSNGQEAFSLAMTLDAYKRNFCDSLDYLIVGSDVSGKMLEVARTGIYPFSQSADIPTAYLKQYVLKSKDTDNPRIKIAKQLRAKVSFINGNLMDPTCRMNLKFKIIFIRNTLIYFDQINRTRILKQVLDHLEHKGYLFLGHSESLINSDLPVTLVGPSIYQKL